LKYGSVKILDARTAEVSGVIDEDRGAFRYQKTGSFQMILSRKDQQPDKWLVQEINRTEGAATAHASMGGNSASGNNLSHADTLQELLKIEEIANEAFRQGDKATVDGLLDENFTYTNLGSRKTWDRATFLSKIKRDKSTQSFRCKDHKLSFDGEVAVLTGICEYHVKNFLISMDVRQQFTDRLKKKDGRWKFLSSQILILPNR
jgi:hypothetical protein